MNITAIDSPVSLKHLFGVNGGRSDAGAIHSGGKAGFESVFRSALDMIEQTNALTNAAEREELNFALGYTDNIGNLMAAQRKAGLSLQYTVAVRNTVMSAYKEIMNLQF